LCAGRIGQILNVASLANDCGIDQKTAGAWLSLLEATYVIYLLRPYYKNIGKRLVKSPKLYFVDTGLACTLLNIKSLPELQSHYLRGGLFESLIVVDILKQQYHQDEKPTLYFWRDHVGDEIDCLIERALTLQPIEIKAGRTVSLDYFKGLKKVMGTSTACFADPTVVYAGDQEQAWTAGRVISWKQAGFLVRPD
jgi:hypothetical protein